MKKEDALSKIMLAVLAVKRGVIDILGAIKEAGANSLMILVAMILVVLMSFVLCVTPAIILYYGGAGFVALYATLCSLELYNIWRRERPLRQYIKKQLERVY